MPKNILEKQRDERAQQMELVKTKKMTLAQAARQLGISYRQTKRIYRRYITGGKDSLTHGNTGKTPVNKTDDEMLAKALELYREKYPDFGPTFAVEKLEEGDGIKISVSVFRRSLIAEGLWEPSKNTTEHRSRRTPKERFGELVQFDGSYHAWFEERGPKCCLITLIDDATKTRLSQFFEQETMFGTMTVLKLWILTYGIPMALYCDKKNAFVLTREPTDKELLSGITDPKSHFGRACDKLGIEVIAANSAQAKGRVERNHGVDQDRLVKELRLAGISTIVEANKFLLETYLPKMNAKFSRPAKSPVDAHVKPGNANLDDILCMEYERTISNDYVVRFQTRLFQIWGNNKPLPRPGDKVIVRVWMDNSVHLIWKDKPLIINETSELFDQN
jgi:transposase